MVSGASSGIGEESALFLNELGYSVAAGVRRLEDGERLRSGASRPDRLHPLLFDVTDDEQVDGARRAVEGLLAGGLRFAGVFSNAGVAMMAGDTSSEGTSMESLERTMAVNFFGAVRFIRAFLPVARASNGRVIVNSALMAKTVLPFNAGYAASKRALEGWCDSLRREVEPHGVRVVLIEAAAISTSLTADHGTVSADNPYPEQLAFHEWASARAAPHQNDPKCAPRRFSELVAHGLQAPRPKARYQVGGGARAISILGDLPTGLQDRVMQRLIASSR